MTPFRNKSTKKKKIKTVKTKQKNEKNIKIKNREKTLKEIDWLNRRIDTNIYFQLIVEQTN